jgi:pimeloyl-ACP methyl ester carboxylesterase
MMYPERCDSVYSLSPLSIKEPEDVFAGRQEICEYWIEGHRTPDNEDALQDAMYGALQLGFSNEIDPLTNAFFAFTHPLASVNWGLKHLTEYKTITLDFFQADREHYSHAGFSKIRCPVKLLFCSEDVAYTLEQSEELLELMQDSGVDASLEQIPACHFGHVGKASEVNQSFINFVHEVDPSTTSLRVPQDALSPFEPHLKKVGYTDDEQSD